MALFFVKSVKKVDASRGLQKDSKKKLSQILRTEAAVRGIEKKANSAKSSRLWPKAVLEALDDSIDNNQWESALKVSGWCYFSCLFFLLVVSWRLRYFSVILKMGLICGHFEILLFLVKYLNNMLSG